MSDTTTWAERCRYAALANILSVLSLAFVLVRSVITVMNDEQARDLNPAIVSFEAKYHVAFLFVAIITLLIREKVSLRVQQVLFAVNLLSAIYMFVNVGGLWLDIKQA